MSDWKGPSKSGKKEGHASAMQTDENKALFISLQGRGTLDQTSKEELE